MRAAVIYRFEYKYFRVLQTARLKLFAAQSSPCKCLSYWMKPYRGEPNEALNWTAMIMPSRWGDEYRAARNPMGCVLCCVRIRLILIVRLMCALLLSKQLRKWYRSALFVPYNDAYKWSQQQTSGAEFIVCLANRGCEPNISLSFITPHASSFCCRWEIHLATGKMSKWGNREWAIHSWCLLASLENGSRSTLMSWWELRFSCAPFNALYCWTLKTVDEG